MLAPDSVTFFNDELRFQLEDRGGAVVLLATAATEWLKVERY
ncbi:hypothetical protein BCEN4_170076 [Burkholderia cenocepacia]|nr:hypothetical protein BCEN4_170076 [Burkholderia cenocepacia]